MNVNNALWYWVYGNHCYHFLFTLASTHTHTHIHTHIHTHSLKKKQADKEWGKHCELNFLFPHPHGLAWRGMAWRGVAWRGVAWRGVAWRHIGTERRNETFKADVWRAGLFSRSRVLFTRGVSCS